VGQSIVIMIGGDNFAVSSRVDMKSSLWVICIAGKLDRSSTGLTCNLCCETTCATWAAVSSNHYLSRLIFLVDINLEVLYFAS